MKKKIAMLLSLLMAVSLLAGCQPADQTNGTTNTSSATTPGSTSTGEEPIEITWAARADIGIMPDPNSDSKKLIEERFNVKITVEQVNIHDKEQYNLYWATGGNPTVLNMNNTAASVFNLADQGLVRSIPEGWLDQYAPTWMQANYTNMGSKEAAQKMISYKGENYIIPYSGPTHGYIMAIRKDWLDNLGMEIPTDEASLIEALKAFTFNDPDKNGVNDTYGIHGGSQKGYMRFGYLMTQFEIWPDCWWQVDDKVIYTDTTDAYRDQLKHLSEIYKLGVVDPAFASEDRVVQRNKWAAGNFGVIVDHASWFDPTNVSGLISIVKENNPDAEIAFIPNWKTLSGKNGQITAFYPDCAGDGSSFFGSSATDEQVKKVLEIYEGIYTDFDFYMQINSGVEGVDWERNEDGVPVKIGEALTGGGEYAMKKGFYCYSIIPKTAEWTAQHNMETKWLTEAYSFCDKNDFMWLYTNFTQPASDAYNTYYADIKTLSDEFYYNCIMNVWDVDKEWDAYQKRLVDAGVNKILDDYNAALFGG